MGAEEKIRVLEMVKEGKVTPEEGMRLLEALETVVEDEVSVPPSQRAKWLRVRVTDTKSQKAKVAVNLPMSIVDWALRAGPRMAVLGGVDLNEMGVNVEELRSAINLGFRGKIVDVTDDEEGQHVEVIVE